MHWSHIRDTSNTHSASIGILYSHVWYDNALDRKPKNVAMISSDKQSVSNIMLSNSSACLSVLRGSQVICNQFPVVPFKDFCIGYFEV